MAPGRHTQHGTDLTQALHQLDDLAIRTRMSGTELSKRRALLHLLADPLGTLRYTGLSHTTPEDPMAGNKNSGPNSSDTGNTGASQPTGTKDSTQQPSVPTPKPKR